MNQNETLNTIDTEALAEKSYREMVTYLENILTRQLERVRKYDLDGAMELAEEAHGLSLSIGQSKVLDRSDYADERWRLQRLYKDIGLIIASEREEVAEKLKQIRQGLRALGIYNQNI